MSKLMVTTNIGLSATRAADLGGFKIALTKFRLTEAVGFTPSVLSESLVGTPVIEGDIESVEAVGQNTVRLGLRVPPGIPAVGQYNLNEVGVYLESGELFGHGVLAQPFAKSGEFGLTLYVYVTASRLGEVINVTEVNSAALPSVANTHSLMSPSQAYSNAVVVLDQHEVMDGADLGGIAIKSGAGGLDWSFVGFNRVCRAESTPVSDTQFIINIGLHRAWLNDGEEVIAHVVAGTGAGQSRKCRYSKSTNTFTVQRRPWRVFDNTSKVSIWRADHHALPTRKPKSPQYLCLGIGQTPSDTSVLSPYTTNGLRLLRVRVPVTGYTPGSFTLDVSSHYADPLPTDRSRILVFAFADAPGAIDLTQSARLTNDQFDISPDGHSLVLNTLTASCVAVELLLIEDVAAESEAGTIQVQEAAYSNAVAQSEFNMPVVLQDVEHVLAYVGDTLLPLGSYTLENGGCTIRLSQPITATEVRFVTFAEDKMERIFGFPFLSAFGPLTSPEQNFTLAHALPSINNLMVFKGESLLRRSEYSLRNDRLALSVTASAGEQVDCFGYFYTYAETVVDESSREDSGPEWTDPAGVDMLPNDLTVRRFKFVGDGVTTTWPTPGVENPIHAWCFVQGQMQRPADVSVSDSSVVLPVIRSGHAIEVYVFDAVSSSGTVTEVSKQTITLTGASSYNIVPPEDTSALLVTIDGVFQHEDAYSLNATRDVITIPGAPVDSVLEIRSWNSVVLESGRTKFGVKVAQVTGPTLTVQIDTGRVSDEVLMLDTIILTADKYQRSYAGPYTIYTLRNIPSNLLGAPLYISYMISGVPTTRLMLRDEALALFRLKDEQVTSSLSIITLGGTSAGAATGVGGKYMAMGTAAGNGSYFRIRMQSTVDPANVSAVEGAVASDGSIGSISGALVDPLTDFRAWVETDFTSFNVSLVKVS